MKNVTNKYVLKPRHRKALREYTTGAVTQEEAARILGTDRQNIDRYIAAITKHAARTGALDFDALIKNY